jgi:hypothetical protein
MELKIFLLVGHDRHDDGAWVLLVSIEMTMTMMRVLLVVELQVSLVQVQVHP